MSEVHVKLVHKTSCWTDVYVDGKYCGELEDPEETVQDVISNLIKYLQIDNTKVTYERKK